MGYRDAGTSGVVKVRFFPLPGAFTFFFALVTLMGGGVPVRGTSSSSSYGGKTEGGGVEVLEFSLKEGEVSLPIDALTAGKIAPCGISPTRSMIKVCGVVRPEPEVVVLRNIGSLELSPEGIIKKKELHQRK